MDRREIESHIGNYPSYKTADEVTKQNFADSMRGTEYITNISIKWEWFLKGWQRCILDAINSVNPPKQEALKLDSKFTV